MRHLGVHNANRSVHRLDRDRKGHASERGPPAGVLALGEPEQALGPGRGRRAALCPEPTQHGAIVVAQHDGLKTLLEPPERLFRVRPVIDKVPDTEESVRRRIERDRAHGALKGAEAAMRIADDDVATQLVEGERGRVHAVK